MLFAFTLDLHLFFFYRLVQGHFPFRSIKCVKKMLNLWYSHCVIYSKVRRHCKPARHLDSFAKVLWWWFCNLHRMYLRDVPHSEVTAISNGREKEKWLFRNVFVPLSDKSFMRFLKQTKTFFFVIRWIVNLLVDLRRYNFSLTHSGTCFCLSNHVIRDRYFHPHSVRNINKRLLKLPATTLSLLPPCKSWLSELILGVAGSLETQFVFVDVSYIFHASF